MGGAALLLFFSAPVAVPVRGAVARVRLAPDVRAEVALVDEPRATVRLARDAGGRVALADPSVEVDLP